jgi:hypothetical protein
LVPPRPDRIEADDVSVRRDELGLGGLPLALELSPGTAEPRRERVRDVVVARHREHREPKVA